MSIFDGIANFDKTIRSVLSDNKIPGVNAGLQNQNLQQVNDANDDVTSSGFNSTISKIIDVASYQNSLMQRGLGYGNFTSFIPNWDQSFPYRLLVLRVNESGQYSMITSYKLPINPQSLQITMPFATKLSVTSDGILEEHNGAPLRQISIQGTTGILPLRESFGVADKPGILGTLFGGTIAAAQQVVNSLDRAISAFLPNQQKTSVASDPVIAHSGYFQFHIMRMFLEAYAEAKKTSVGTQLRLAFEMPKDGIIYLITPQVFNMTKSVASPMEYNYTFQATAWATIDGTSFGSRIADSILQPGVRNTNTLVKIVNTLRNARSVIQKSKALVSAVNSDVNNNIIGPINQVILFTKDLAGLGTALNDLPNNIKSSFANNILKNSSNISNSFSGTPEIQQQLVKATANTMGDPTNAGGSFNLTPVGMDSLLDNPDFSDNVNLSTLPITGPQQVAVSNVLTDARATNINDVNNLIGNLQSTSDALIASLNGGTPTEDQFDILYGMQDSIVSLSSLTVTDDMDNDRTIDPLQFWNIETSTNNIPFTEPKSKFAVPFPFKGTLEWLAQTYLGDGTRWMEIASINGLQAPYIDEEGFFYDFISNGSGNQFNVSSKDNLFVGQTVFILSDTQPMSKRVIQTLSKVTDSNFLLTVDGDPNLGLFTSTAHAKLKAFLPNTVNSSQVIYIPSDITPFIEDPSTKPISYLNVDKNVLRFSKIDLLLDSKGDLAITSDGFANLAFGMTNLVQAAKLKVTTNINGLLLHPGYGLGTNVGDTQAEVNPSDILKNLNTTFGTDPRFREIENFQITRNNGALTLSLVAKLADNIGTLPLSVQLTGQ